MASSIVLSSVSYTGSNKAVHIQGDVAQDDLLLGLYLVCCLASRFLEVY